MMGSHFTAKNKANVLIPIQKDVEIYDFVKMIVKKNLPLSVVEDPDYRQVFKHTFKYSRALIRDIIFHLVPMVKKAISGEMKEAGYGGVMHDGWRKFGTHYVALFAQFNRIIQQNLRRITRRSCIPTNVLLAMGPMLNVPVPDDTEDNKETGTEMNSAEATRFTAEVHDKYFKDVFREYEIEFEEWAKAQVRHFLYCNFSLNLIRLLIQFSRPQIAAV